MFYLGQSYWVHPELIFLFECIPVQSYENYVFIFRKKMYSVTQSNVGNFK